MPEAVGNDVVYLADPEIADHRRRDRFVERVCNADECERVRGSDRSHELLWTLFAAKEAAYKAVVKLRPGTVFAHRRFGVSASLTQVAYEGLSLGLRISAEKDWVHAIACSGEGPTVAAVERMPEGAQQSEAVRALAIRSVVTHFGLPGEALSIDRPPDRHARDRLAPPRLLRDGRPVPIDISLSHDGPFVACAAVALPTAAAS